MTNAGLKLKKKKKGYMCIKKGKETNEKKIPGNRCGNSFYCFMYVSFRRV